MWARFSASVQTGPEAHPVSYTMGTGSFTGVKSSRGVTLTPHRLLVPLVMKEYSYTSTPPMGRTACTEPQCLYKGDLYLYSSTLKCFTIDVKKENRNFDISILSTPVTHVNMFFVLPFWSEELCSRCVVSLLAIVLVLN